MKIDYISDTHLDFYLKTNCSQNKFRKFIDKLYIDENLDIIIPGEVLLLAGDLSHYNQLTVDFVKEIKEYKGYKKIFCVSGNHDFYLVSDSQVKKYKGLSANRQTELREMLEVEEDIHHLDMEIVNYKGVAFGGGCGWYDDTYRKFLKDDWYYTTINPKLLNMDKNELWKQSMNDYKYIYGLENFMDKFNVEYNHLLHIYKNVDIMITHINPSNEPTHQNPLFKGEISTGYYCFDGLDILDKTPAKHWVYGHSHSEFEYDVYDVKCYCNPLGYPNENYHVYIKSFEI